MAGSSSASLEQPWPAAAAAPGAAPRRFRLVRYFSLASLLAVVTVIAGLAGLYDFLSTQLLLRLGEQKNVALTRSLYNALTPALLHELAPLRGLAPAELRAHPNLVLLREKVLRQASGLSVVKVKIYGLDGMTLFSTEAAQIGEDKSGNAAVMAAVGGRASSELTFRERFSAFEQVIEKRDLVSSYIPLRDGQNRITGVFEVYDDVTSLMAEVHGFRFLVIASMAVLLLALYGVLWLIVRRGDRLIARHQREIRDGEAALKRKAARLEAEVAMRRRTEEDLRAATMAAEQASRAKSEFFAHMSHELRTPLNAIIGFAEAIGKEVFGPLGSTRYREYVGDIHASGVHLLEIINDLLDMAKIEAGKFELQREPLDVAPLLSSCVRMVGQRADNAGIRLDIELPAEAAAIHGDYRALKQILINLLSNAIKFTPEGGRVTLSARQTDGSWICLEVTDTGVGIAEEDLARVLEPYAQSECGKRANEGGTGLGLAIVQQLVALHEGRFTLESRVGEGTRARVELPLAA